jgi:hypothetical protein
MATKFWQKSRLGNSRFFASIVFRAAAVLATALECFAAAAGRPNDC